VLAAISIVKKYKRGVCEVLPVVKKPVITWNNQNFKIVKNTLSFPIWIDGRSKRISVACVLTDYQLERLNTKLGSLRITQKNGKWIAQIAVEPMVVVPVGDCTMGVDLGLKVSAVAVLNTGKTKFFGNGRQNKFQKRKFRSKRKELGRAKKQMIIKKLNNKEQRWMKDQDHKISRQIVDFARDNNVSIIHLEQLQNIRNTARTSRKNEKNLHTWSFYRLTQFITYKAALLGIMVEFVDPAYTSQACPICGTNNRAKDRRYLCGCGFKSHRDRVGAINIITAPVVSGKRKSA
jgi:IS605 OrfB family transposase